MAQREYQRPICLPRHRSILDRVLRRLFDTVCAAAGLACLVPLFVIIALAIKLDDGGPVLYSHFRVGKGLRKFRLLKFRSMILQLRGRQYGDGAPGRAGHAGRPFSA